jgi:hypothetical protein
VLPYGVGKALPLLITTARQYLLESFQAGVEFGLVFGKRLVPSVHKSVEKALLVLITTAAGSFHDFRIGEPPGLQAIDSFHPQLLFGQFTFVQETAPFLAKPPFRPQPAKKHSLRLRRTRPEGSRRPGGQPK